MPTKTTGKGLQRVTSRVWYVTNPDKPRPQEHVRRGRGHAAIHLNRDSVF